MDSEQLDEIMQESRLEYNSEPQRCFNCQYWTTTEIMGDTGLCVLRCNDVASTEFETAEDIMSYIDEHQKWNDEWCNGYELDEEKIV